MVIGARQWRGEDPFLLGRGERKALSSEPANGSGQYPRSYLDMTDPTEMVESSPAELPQAMIS